MTLIIATRNQHKVEEIRAILGRAHPLLALADLPQAPEVIEDAGTFAGNATKKAVELAQYLARGAAREKLTDDAFVLADDSGLEVDVLGGAPGVHSARFAAIHHGTRGNSSDADNRAKLLRRLEGVPAEQRNARFRCVIALTPLLKRAPESASPVCAADECELQTRIFEGACEGRIITGEKGQGGFGYDSLFVPAGHELTFGELAPEIKNGLSHRARALEKVAAFLQTQR
jgi:XTP/dITP diphosphohydrolase